MKPQNKILIGTPIHQVKDYIIKRWLENVVGLTRQTPADLLLVDNSPGLDYVAKVKTYCQELGLKNCHLDHLDFLQGKETGLEIQEQIHKRVACSREFIRQEILVKGYESWFCWECDQIIPNHALQKLITMMALDDFWLVDHNGWGETEGEPNFDLGVALMSRACLEKYSFLPDFDHDLTAPNSWYNVENWYRQRLKKDGCPIIEVFGVIEPILHIHH